MYIESLLKNRILWLGTGLAIAACGGSESDTGGNEGTSTDGGAVGGQGGACTNMPSCFGVGMWGQPGGTPPGGAGGPPATPGCGNGRIEPGEQCDGANVNNQTCASLTMNAQPNGQVTCNPTNCTFVLQCSTNGNTGGTGGVNGGTGGNGTGGR